MKRLIVNADDLGINPQRTHGIFLCVEEGIVRSCSLLPNFADSNTAAKHARERDVSCGLHLNFTEGAPLSTQSDISSLLTPDGFFLGRQTLRRMLGNGEIDPMHIEREARAQVEWCFDTYGMPTHIDGHHHVHIHPVIVPLLLPIFDRYGIALVRIPSEVPLPPFGYNVSEEQLKKTEVINAQAEEARTLFAAHGIRSTDHFRGSTIVGNASLKNLRHILNKLPEGTTELMVHPGSQNAIGDAFELDPQRQTELRMLTDDSIPTLLTQLKIELCSFGDLL